jgi:hypothetical protein
MPRPIVPLPMTAICRIMPRRVYRHSDVIPSAAEREESGRWQRLPPGFLAVFAARNDRGPTRCASPA